MVVQKNAGKSFFSVAMFLKQESNGQPEALRKVRQSRFIGRGFVPEAVVSRSESVGLAGAFKGNNILDSSDLRPSCGLVLCLCFFAVCFCR